MIKVGVVGYGRFGRHVARNLAKVAHVVVVDVDNRAVDDARDAGFDARLVQTFRPVEDDPLHVDAVAICTPIPTHEDLVRAALGKSAHVWCEKPLARSRDAARRLCDLARAKGLVLFTDHTAAFEARFHRLRAQVKPDEVAWVFSARGSRVEDARTDLLPHDVVLARAIAGGYPVPLHVAYNAPCRHFAVGLRDGRVLTLEPPLPDDPEPLELAARAFVRWIEEGVRPEHGTPEEALAVAEALESAA